MASRRHLCGKCRSLLQAIDDFSTIQFTNETCSNFNKSLQQEAGKFVLIYIYKYLFNFTAVRGMNHGLSQHSQLL